MDQLLNNIVYVHAGSSSEFNEYQRQNSDYVCYLLHDDTTLRGREYGQIVRIGSFKDKWNHQAIEESIMIEQSIWSAQDTAHQSNDDEDNTEIMEYGIGT